MKNIKIILLLVLVIILSGCSQKGISINDEILDEKQGEEIEVNLDLVEFDDFELVENPDWLVAFEENEMPELTEDPNFIREKEFIELEEGLLEKMELKNLDTDGMYLIRNDNKFLIFWNRKKGKIYLYDNEKESLQFLLDTDIPKEEPEEGWPVSLFFYEDFLLRGATNENSLYYATEEYFYKFDHEGRQLLKKEIPDGFKVTHLQKDYGVFMKEGKTYVYSYDNDSISHVFHKNILQYYKEYIIFQEENEIYCINLYDNKIYYHKENIENMRTLIFPETDKIYFIDLNNIDAGPVSYKINLPNL